MATHIDHDATKVQSWSATFSRASMNALEPDGLLG